MKNKPLKFTGVVFQEGRTFVSICPELDVSSCGNTAARAKRMLQEAVTIYLETAIAHNLPYLRPIPPSDNPLQDSSVKIKATFDLEVDVHLIAHAA